MNSFDETWFRWANGGLGATLDAWLPRIGEASNAPPWILAAVFVLTALGNRRAWATALLMLACVAVTDPVNRFVVKRSFDRERPCQVRDDVVLRHSHCPSSSSFPSSHALNSAALATVVAVRHPVLAVPAAVLTALIGLSRVHGGVHYPSDVLAGWAIGFAVGLAFAVPSRRRSLTTRVAHAWDRASATATARFESLGERRWGLVLAAMLATGAALAVLGLGAAGLELSPVEAARWVESRRVTPGDLATGGGMAWMIHATTSVLGDTALGVRAGPLLLGMGFAAALFALARRVCASSRDAFVAVLLMTCTPLAAASARLAIPAAAAALTWTLVLLGVERGSSRGGTLPWIGAALALGAGVRFEPALTVGLAGFGAAAFGASARRRGLQPSPGPWIGLILAAALVAPVVRGGLGLGPLQPSALRAVVALGTQFLWLTPWVAVALVVGIARSLDLARRGELTIGWLAWATAAPLALGGVASALYRLPAATLATFWVGAAVAAAPALTGAFDRTQGRDRRAAVRLSKLCLVSSLVAVGLATSPQLFRRVHGDDFAPRPVLETTGWSGLARHVRALASDWRAQGMQPRVATDRPAVAAELELMLPEHPEVVMLEPSGEPPRDRRAAGTRLPERADALFVTGDAGLHPAVALGFRRCVEAPRFTPRRSGAGPGPTRVYWCERFRGLAGIGSGP